MPRSSYMTVRAGARGEPRAAQALSSCRTPPVGAAGTSVVIGAHTALRRSPCAWAAPHSTTPAAGTANRPAYMYVSKAEHAHSWHAQAWRCTILSLARFLKHTEAHTSSHFMHMLVRRAASTWLQVVRICGYTYLSAGIRGRRHPDQCMLQHRILSTCRRICRHSMLMLCALQESRDTPCYAGGACCEKLFHIVPEHSWREAARPRLLVITCSRNVPAGSDDSAVTQHMHGIVAQQPSRRALFERRYCTEYTARTVLCCLCFLMILVLYVRCYRALLHLMHTADTHTVFDSYTAFRG